MIDRWAHRPPKVRELTTYELLQFLNVSRKARGAFTDWELEFCSSCIRTINMRGQLSAGQLSTLAKDLLRKLWDCDPDLWKPPQPGEPTMDHVAKMRERAVKVASELIGSSDSIVERATDDELCDHVFCARLDELAFECVDCSNWYGVEEKQHVNDEFVCSNCFQRTMG